MNLGGNCKSSFTPSPDNQPSSLSNVCPSCALINTDNQPNVVIAPTTNLSHIPTTQSQEGRVTRNRNVVSNTTQAGQAERQVLHQNQMIFSSIPSPAALNVGLLNTLFVFKPGSYLKTFLTDKTNVYKTYYSLAEILTILKDVVRGEKLFDPNNPSIILCSPGLKRALNMKALHVTQIRSQVMDHITKVPEHAFRTQFVELERQRERERQKRHNDLLTGRIPSHPIHPDNMTREMRQQLRHHVIQRSQPQENQDQIRSTGAPLRHITLAETVSQTSDAHNIYKGLISQNDRFQLRPKVLRLMQSMSGVGQGRTIFSFEEVTELLSE
jgi:hypothetical protein